MKDSDIILEIKKGNREISLKHLYKEYPKIKANIISSGGNKQIAQEIFNDSLLLLVEKLENPNFQLTSKLSTFLYGIARLLWMNELRRKEKKIDNLEWKDTLIVTNEDINYNYDKERKLDALEHIINSISEKCQQLFKLFYYQKESMKSIDDKLNFSSINSAKTQKYKCLEKAIQLSKNINY
jgi:RNA polymerase sigma factor (sigma-70 family)